MFGHGPFGAYPFGESDWSNRTVWGSVPRRLRSEDQAAQGLFKLILSSIGQEFDLSRREIRSFPLQRDPYKALSSPEVSVGVSVVSASVVTPVEAGAWSAAGHLVRLVLSEPEIEIGPGWSTRGLSPLTVVRSIHHRSPAEVWVVGVSPPVAPLDLQFYPPDVIRHLGMDYGLELDANEPTYFQRRTVASAHLWWSFKGSAAGYIIRGSMAGWDLSIAGLWRIQSEEIWNSLPSGSRISIPEGSENLYTPVPPRMARYDEIPGDVIPCDSALIYEDDSPDGMSPGMAWAEDLGTLEVVGSTPLTAEQAETFGVPFGHDVELSVPAPIQPFMGYLDAGSFGIRPVSDPGQVYWIDREISRSFPQMNVVVSTVTPPPVGEYILTYRPPESESCDWCYSHRVQVIAVPRQELIDSGAELSKAHERLMEKLKSATPLHVELNHVYSLEIEIAFADEVEVEVEVG